MFSYLRSRVSKNKRRFKRDGFNLDLSYITDRIIAMAFPSKGFEGLYRHSQKEVLEFLNTFHAGRYKLFNLCSEKEYDHSVFGGNVERIPFDDHNPAPLNYIMKFCKSADAWLQLNVENVIAIHCKAGKGRTGLMICAYLLYTMEFTNVQDVFRFYGEKRTIDGRGLTIPSQRRYVANFLNILNHGELQPKQLVFVSIRFTSATIEVFHFNIFCNYANGSHELELLVSSTEEGSVQSTLQEALFVTYNLRRILIKGDTKVEVLNKEKNRLFYFWFDTSFVDSELLVLTRNELDKPVKSLDVQVQLRLPKA